MIVALKGTVPETPLVIEVENDPKKGEVRLKFNNHCFIVCKSEGSQHNVEMIDVDSGIVYKGNIESLCWRR